VKSISGQVHGSQGKKRKMVMRFARRLLQLKKDSTPVQLTVRNVLLTCDSYFSQITNTFYKVIDMLRGFEFLLIRSHRSLSSQSEINVKL
jgi:hypothetical protein